MVQGFSFMEKRLAEFYKNKKILITGATGFKGSWLSLWLLEMGAKVYGVGYSPNKNKNLFYQLKLDRKIDYSITDIRNIKSLKKIISKFKPEIVFHMAAQPLIFKGYQQPYDTYMINSIGTLNILEILRNDKFIKSIICVTSDKCYESNNSTRGFLENDKLGGVDPYSGSKASAEIIIQTYYNSFFKNKKKCGLASARAGNVIGGGDWSPDRLIPDCIKSINQNKVIFLRNPYFNRPWQHVLEPLNGYLMLAKKLYEKPEFYSSAWNFGSKKNTVTSVYEVVKKIKQLWGKGNIKINKTKMFYEQENLQLDIRKSQKYLKWTPKLTIAESIQVTVEWYKYIYAKGTKNTEEITLSQIRNFSKK